MTVTDGGGFPLAHARPDCDQADGPAWAGTGKPWPCATCQPLELPASPRRRRGERVIDFDDLLDGGQLPRP